YDDYDDGYSRKPKRGSDQTRRLVFYAILIAIIVICIVALIKLLGGSKKPVETEPPETSPSISVPVEQTTPPTQTEPPEETEPPEPTSVDRIHVVVTGDSWWGICMRYYDRASETLCEKLAEYNDMSVTNLYVGNEIAIPPLSELLGD
ncbi:MAG: LysM peptidoglycan-binding domain-containing protein, partial [Clostridiales bacterium]|nr:LysM peptidoglycan-binding domain-containing protein [Clostridiales bacterium]